MDGSLPQPPGSIARGRWAHMVVITPQLLQRILEDYPLPLSGIHSVAHWARVLENGRRLAPLAGADPAVVELFALFHDARRMNDGFDPEHGARGATLARALLSQEAELDLAQLDLLEVACRDHSRGLRDGDVTVQTCWDADRLDLLRAGTLPLPQFLCTEAARDPLLIAWANGRSMRREVPALVWEEWGIRLAGP
jgi:uncharacterized protein